MSPEMLKRLDDIWPELKVIVLRGVDPLLELSQLTCLLSINHGRTLQQVYIGCGRTGEDCGYLTRTELENSVRLIHPRDSTTRPELYMGLSYPRLSCVRLQNYSIYPERARKVLETSVQQGRLHTLDLGFPLAPLRVSQGSICQEYLEGYEFLKGCTSIRHIGFQAFGFNTYYPAEEVQAFTDFLETFPNLRSVELRGPADRQDTCILIEAIARRTTVKTIYHNVALGTYHEPLSDLLASLNVGLEWGFLPMYWPVPPEELDQDEDMGTSIN